MSLVNFAIASRRLFPAMASDGLTRCSCKATMQGCMQGALQKAPRQRASFRRRIYVVLLVRGNSDSGSDKAVTKEALCGDAVALWRREKAQLWLSRVIHQHGSRQTGVKQFSLMTLVAG
jgi:hypothetical protein